jgi:hypothetical protein
VFHYVAHILQKAGVSEPAAHSVAFKLCLKSYDEQEVIWAKGTQVQSWQFIITGLVAATAPTCEERSVPISTMALAPGSVSNPF